jgi:hypothetical protein
LNFNWKEPEMTQRQRQDDRANEAALSDADPERGPRGDGSPATAESGAMAGEGEPADGAVDPRIAATAGTAHGWALNESALGDAEGSLDESLVPESQPGNPAVDPTAAEPDSKDSG